MFVSFVLGLMAGAVGGAFLLSLLIAGKMADLDNEVALWRGRARHAAGFGDGE
jgi:hypothetical protein